MKRSTYLMIDVLYIGATLLGALNFSFDRRTGAVRAKTHITIYSGFINVMVVTVVLYLAVTIEFKTTSPGRDELYYKFNVFLMVTRLTIVLINLLYNWINLSHFIHVMNSFRNFSVKFIRKWAAHKIYEKHLERGICRRCQYTFLADICIYIGTVLDLRDLYDIESDLVLLFLALIPTSLNVLMTFYFIPILNTNILLAIINNELRRILATAFGLQQNKQSKSTLVRQSQKLSKELDDLAEAQSKLKTFYKSINKMFNLQSACLMLNLYVSNICVFYLFCLFCSEVILWNGYKDWTVYHVPIYLLIYYMDLKVFMFEVLKTEDLMKNTPEILRELCDVEQKIDKCLEKSVSEDIWKFINKS